MYLFINKLQIIFKNMMILIKKNALLNVLLKLLKRTEIQKKLNLLIR